MKRITLFSALMVLLVFAISGCCTKCKPLEDRNFELLQNISDMNGKIQALETDYTQKCDELQDMASKYKEEHDKFVEADKKVRYLLDRKTTPVIISEIVKQKLRDIAGKYPNQLEFDEANNVLRVKESVTFPSGVATISPKSKEALTAVAGVLKTVVGIKFRIDGHTDNDPISKTARFNKSNMDLSLKRAHAVWSVLVAAGMPKQNLFCAGFSMYKPIASNNTKAGKKINRRVEITLLSKK